MKNIFIVLLFSYLRLINFQLPLILAQEECAKINNILNRPFFGYLSAQELVLCKSLKYFFRKVSEHISIISICTIMCILTTVLNLSVHEIYWMLKYINWTATQNWKARKFEQNLEVREN